MQAQLHEEAARAELAALQARINPHFFFNTLNTISSLLDEDPREAEEIVQTLAELFRYTFKVADSGPVKLREELDFTRNYLTIEQARFEERLRVEWQLEPEALEVPVPGLIVQPLVENAVGHGIAPRAEGGMLRISASVEDGRLHVEVRDDGVGLDGAPGSMIQDGHGLGNIAQRLEAFYRGAGSIRLSANPEGAGTLVQLELPSTVDPLPGGTP